MIRKVLAFLAVVSVWGCHPASAQFAEQASWAGTGAGSANAQTLTLPNALTLADILGVNIKWIPSNGNTGATTLNVNGIGAQAIQRVTPAGMVALGGGEIVAGHVAIAMWNGTAFDLQNSAAPDPPGHVMDYAGAACPTGWGAANAATVSQATQAPLYGVLASIWGSNAGGNFTLPDLRGRATFGQDSGGSNRITSAGGNFDGTVIGGTGGQQNKVVAQANLPAVGVSIPSLSVSATSTTLFTSGPFVAQSGTGALGVTAEGTVTSTGTTGTGTTGNLGSGTALPVLSNAAIVNKCVRF